MNMYWWEKVDTITKETTMMFKMEKKVYMNMIFPNENRTKILILNVFISSSALTNTPLQIICEVFYKNYLHIIITSAIFWVFDFRSYSILSH